MDLIIDKDTNDLIMSSGDFVTTTGIEEGAQRIRDRLLTFKNEFFLNLSYGLDYFNKIYPKNTRTSVIAAHVRSEILKSVDGKIISFESSLKDGDLSISYGLIIDGETLTDELTLRRITAKAAEIEYPDIDYIHWSTGEAIEWAESDFMEWE